MKSYILNLFLLTAFPASLAAQRQTPVVVVEKGVSRQLAVYRSKNITDIQYRLHFLLPPNKNQPIDGTAAITFNLKEANQPVQLDFKQAASHVKSVLVNGTPCPVVLEKEHLLIAQNLLKSGSNTVEIQFIAGDESLNRNTEYLYALFVPDHARNTFPCFDQPDLKAVFKLSLTVPRDWKVLANGKVKDSLVQVKNTTYTFQPTEKLPTYLFSFAAGQFTELNKTLNGRKMTFLHRETDLNRIRLSTDSVFLAHRDALSFLENWTGIPYPFQKVGFVAIPDFQFGGMEHPGTVQYKASSLFLGEGSTKDQFISRANLISHETAHMWFGDLVTMKWFNDVWMKEVFANFIADKVTEKLMGQETFNLKFLQDHYPAAYAVDRTTGANPIRQRLNNLNEAGSMYGNIIYHKAPIMMRQLEELMGPARFQRGICEYLQTYSYQNATWDDLIAILDKYSDTDLYAWNKVWVNQSGRPVFDYQVKYTGDRIKSFSITQQSEMKPKRVWPQRFGINLIYPDTVIRVPVQMAGGRMQLKTLKGLKRPTYIQFNADGRGYGVFPEDTKLLDHLYLLKDPVARASAYINAYENALNGTTQHPERLLKIFSTALSSESNEMNLRLLTGYIGNIYWSFSRPTYKQRHSLALEQAIWSAMEQQSGPNHKKILFSAYQNIYGSDQARQRIYKIWKNQRPPAGIKLIDDDYTSLALSIALRDTTPSTVLSQQQQRITNADRKERLAFLMPSLSSNASERKAFFERLKDPKNREKESWVLSALLYLHHPLRQHTSLEYLPESLMLLEEIQQTGDIFFPQSWLSATFGSYQSAEAYQVIKDFLKAHPDYNSNLRDKILQATDNLRRNQLLSTGAAL